eukprot:TRINITY_DN13564_c0_g1_i1.p1 TRINITY_DN13564_c0_g1~~TRINITY_DN13564_c0_g1_i1.p1  ORF type:complete len:320 (-),score=112.01 TRINITY_DN13564_c0_g1_i1:273-1232(-)
MSNLDSLKENTIIVADTGDFNLISQFKPLDTTTNPSLIYQAAQKPEYENLVNDAINYAKEQSENIDEQVKHALDKLSVNFGLEILKIIEGRVSTEIDARLSFDTEGTIQKGKQLIKLYEEAGISRDRILLKIASTWEGIEAAKYFESQGIHCNMTLIFSIYQAMACAEASATLISPFCGRISDFYKTKLKVDSFDPSEDPGVVSVQEIWRYYKTYGYETVVMGASFRSKEQVLELNGCDLLTVSPSILEQLKNIEGDVPLKLSKVNLSSKYDKITLTESDFRYKLNDDEMAHFKLAEGIRRFASDTIKLEDLIIAKLQN